MGTQIRVVNLSKRKLSPLETDLLSKGLTFAPTPGQPDPGQARADLSLLHEHLRQKAWHREKELQACIDPSPSQPSQGASQASQASDGLFKHKV